jgi:hypothetical protein
MVAATFGPGDLDVLHRIARGDVLQHDLQAAEALDDRAQHLVDEGLFRSKTSIRRVGGLAVDQQRQAELLHFLQCSEAARDARHARSRMRGCAGGIELGAVHLAGEFGACDLFGRRVVGEVQSS